MATADTIPAWITLFLGIYSFAAAMGELRMPGTWKGMMHDLEQSPGMRFIAGLFTLLSISSHLGGPTTGCSSRSPRLAAC